MFRLNKINPKKLLNSTWTAVHPVQKELHFIVTDLRLNQEGEVVHCELEAIMTKRSRIIEWQTLTDSDEWLQGWK